MDTCARYRLPPAYARTALRLWGFLPAHRATQMVCRRRVPRFPDMDEHFLLRCIDLRYLLITHIYDHGIVTVDDLVESLTRQGFVINGRPSKTVSDALRTDVKIGRVIRRGRGRYGPGVMPRATEHRIDRRVHQLRAEVTALAAQDGRAA